MSHTAPGFVDAVKSTSRAPHARSLRGISCRGRIRDLVIARRQPPHRYSLRGPNARSPLSLRRRVHAPLHCGNGEQGCDGALQLLMTTVTQRGIATVFASAEVDRFGFCGLEFNRGEPGALMTAIAERLLSALSAGAPEVALTRLNRHRIRCFLRNVCRRHQVFSQVEIKLTARHQIGNLSM